MQKDEIIRYVDMTIEEGMNLQRGMNYNIQGRAYHIILMSVRPNAPYANEWIEEENTIIYEGHDVQKNYNYTDLPCDQIDQPMNTPSSGLTENGKFYEAALRYRNNCAKAEIVKVYEKIRDSIWVYNGFFQLVDAWIQKSGNRNVFKFKLVMLEDEKSQRKHLTFRI